MFHCYVRLPECSCFCIWRSMMKWLLWLWCVPLTLFPSKPSFETYFCHSLCSIFLAKFPCNPRHWRGNRESPHNSKCHSCDYTSFHVLRVPYDLEFLLSLIDTHHPPQCETNRNPEDFFGDALESEFLDALDTWELCSGEVHIPLLTNVIVSLLV